MKKQKKSSYKQVNTETDTSIKRVVITIVIIVFVLGLFYALTLFILNKRDFHINTNASISYTKIIAGESFNKKDEDYLVFYYNFLEHSDYTELVSSYREKEKHLPLYVVDLSEGINKSVLADKDNIAVNSIKDLKIKESAIIRFKDGKVNNSATDSFEEFLNNNAE